MAEIKEVVYKNNYQLDWLLLGNDVPKEEIKVIYNGIIKVLEMFESSINACYHLINSDLIKPQFALKVKAISVNGILQELSFFEKFNNDNEELVEKFN